MHDAQSADTYNLEKVVSAYLPNIKLRKSVSTIHRKGNEKCK